MEYLNFTDLRIKISRHFDDSELQGLCFDLQIDYEALQGSNKEDRIRSLILYCQRHAAIDRLVGLCENLRPVVKWEYTSNAIDLTLPDLSIENLPPIKGTFIGRAAEIDRVLEGLILPYPLISIEGIGGAGKSTLAIKVAQLCISGGIDGLDLFSHIVWVSAKDKPNSDLTLEDVNQAIAYRLGYPKLAQFDSGALRAAVNNLLRINRTLVIVDNFETVTDITLMDFLQRIPVPSKGMITSRYQQMRRLWDVSLTGLSEQETLDKIRDDAHSLGLNAIKLASKEALLPLVHITGGNPLAIEMALGYISNKDMALDRVIKSLVEANEDVEELFDYLFKESWNILTEEERKLLVVMPFFADSVHRRALEKTADVHGGYLSSSLARLRTMSLIEVSEELVEAKKRYSSHPLVLAFARKQFNSLSDEERIDSRHRWARHYLDFASEMLIRDVPAEPYWNTLLGRNLDQVDSELANLISVLSWAAEAQEDQILVDLMMVLVHYLGRRAHHERVKFSKLVVEAAQRLGDKYVEALFRIDALGWAHIESGRAVEGKEQILLGLEAARAIEDKTTRMALVALARAFQIRVYLNEGNEDEAKRCVMEIGPVEAYPEVLQDRINLAAGDLATHIGDYSHAIDFYKAAIQNNERYGGDHPKVEAQYRIGDAYLSLKKVDLAESKYQEVLAEYQVSSNFDLAHALYGLACVARYRADYEEAYRFGREARKQLSLININHGVLVDKIEEITFEMERTISSRPGIYE